MGLVDEKYMVLTTFRKSGDPVATTVWLADVGNGEVGFWTSSESGKVKRLKHTPRVTVQPSNMKGDLTPGTEAVETTARVVTGAELEAVREQIVSKYGFMTKITKAIVKITSTLQRRPFPYGDVGVVVTVPDALK